MLQNPAADLLCTPLKALHHLIISLTDLLCTFPHPNRVKLTPQANVDTLYNVRPRYKEMINADCRGKFRVLKSDYVKTYRQIRTKWIHQWLFNILEVIKTKREGKKKNTKKFLPVAFSFIFIESLQRSPEAATARDLKPLQPPQSAELHFFYIKPSCCLFFFPSDYSQLVQKPMRETTENVTEMYLKPLASLCWRCTTLHSTLYTLQKVIPYTCNKKNPQGL